MFSLFYSYIGAINAVVYATSAYVPVSQMQSYKMCLIMYDVFVRQADGGEGPGNGVCGLGVVMPLMTAYLLGDSDFSQTSSQYHNYYYQ